MQQSYVINNNRGILRISGSDRHTFLQGLITNDIYKVSESRATYSALLTPQGKFLYDFFIVEFDDSFLLDCEADRLSELQQKLHIYKLRLDVEFNDVSSEYTLIFCLGHTFDLPSQAGVAHQYHKGVIFIDPRFAKLGVRAILPTDFDLQELKLPSEDYDTYDKLRLSFGIPDGSRDMIPEKAIPLECGLDDLNAIDWDKGCYMGQELTARTKYRGLVRKRLLPVKIDGPTPPFKAPIMSGDQEVGSMRTSCSEYGIALLRLTELVPLTANKTRLTPYIPEWMKL